MQSTVHLLRLGIAFTELRSAQQPGKASHVGSKWQMLTVCPATSATQQGFAAHGKLWHMHALQTDERSGSYRLLSGTSINAMI